MHKKDRHFYLRFLWTLLLLSGLWLVLSIWLSYEVILQTLTKHYKLDSTQQLKLRQLFSPRVWQNIQWVTLLATTLIAWRAPQLLHHLHKAVSYTGNIFSTLKQYHRQQPMAIWLGLAAAMSIVAFQIWCIGQQPLPLLDEAFSYVHLVRRGVLVCLSYYPGPNHHVLHNLLATIANQLLPAFWAMKIPTLLATCLLTLWAFYTAHRHFRLSRFSSFIAAQLLVVLPGILVYASLGRGYMLQSFLAAAGISFSLRLADPDARFGWVVTHVIGLYTVPSHLYAWLAQSIALVFWYGWQDRKLWQLIVSSCCWAAILYSPFFLVQGWGFWQSPFIIYYPPHAWIDHLLPHLYYVYSFLFGGPQQLWLAIVFLSWYLLWLANHKIKFGLQDLLLLSMLIAPWIIAFLQGYLPPERVWIYQLVAWWWLFMRLCTSQKWLVYPAALWIVLQMVNHKNNLANDWQESQALRQIIEQIPSSTCTIGTNDDWIYTILLYYQHSQTNSWSCIAYPPQKTHCQASASVWINRVGYPPPSAEHWQLLYQNQTFALYTKKPEI